jgi:hypothetical protein
MGEEVIGYMAEIRAALPSVEWTPLDGNEATAEHEAKFFTGTHPVWSVVISAFSIEAQGFPPGTLGFDGAARACDGRFLVVRLTRALAEEAYRLAVASPVPAREVH